jgi:hypothetical protein
MVRLKYIYTLKRKNKRLMLDNPYTTSTMAMRAIATEPSVTTMYPFASKLKTLVRTLRN